jgi:hypothetical protein
MKTNILKKLRATYNSDFVPPEFNRSYQRQWVKQVRRLGDKWLLAKPVNRTVERVTDVAV